MTAPASETSEPFHLDKHCTINDLLRRNADWAARMKAQYPTLFPTNGRGQSPHTLWLGCSDSRAGETIVDVNPGEIFVHRNIANLAPFGDLSSLSVIQFAVEVLGVSKIVVCGHLDCGGVWASLATRRVGGVLDHWLRNVRDVKARNKKILDGISDPKAKADKLVELNVIAQVHNIRRHESVVEALLRGQLEIHGVVYDVGTGLLKLLDVPVDEFEKEYITEEGGVDEHH